MILINITTVIVGHQASSEDHLEKSGHIFIALISSTGRSSRVSTAMLPATTFAAVTIVPP
jgi:hypothetical protein